MTLKKAYKILKRHNAWRRDNEGKHPMQDPTEIGKALDTLLTFAKKALMDQEPTEKFRPKNPVNPN